MDMLSSFSCRGWGRINPEHAVDSMIQHADSGFTTFDMADHCELLTAF